MKAKSFNVDTAKTTKIYKKNKKQPEIWMHLPKNETSFKKNPYIEINLENTPRKKEVTSIHITLKEIETIITDYKSKEV